MRLRSPEKPGVALRLGARGRQMVRLTMPGQRRRDRTGEKLSPKARDLCTSYALDISLTGRANHLTGGAWPVVSELRPWPCLIVRDAFLAVASPGWAQSVLRRRCGTPQSRSAARLGHRPG
jgi:hypothetical protein